MRNRSALKVELLQALKDNFIALIVHPPSSTCVAVDPSEAEPVLRYLKEHQLKLSEIWNTHHHWDHTGGNKKLKEETGAFIRCSRHDLTRISDADHGLEHREVFEFASIRFETIAVPGHTLGHIAIFSASERILFTGDTLFSLGCGRIFEGTHQMMFDSLQKLKALPDETLLYCGHEYTEANLDFALQIFPNDRELQSYRDQLKTKLEENGSSLPSQLGLEKKLNPFLRAQDIESFKRYRDLKDQF